MSVIEGRHVVLVGLMGSGKSTVGRVLADELDRPLLDSDDLVEARAGRSVRDIWVDDGEEVFRALESEALAEALASPTPAVIAGAGGIVLREENRTALADAGAYVVWLLADDDVLLERVRAGAHRPALDDDAAAALARMRAERAPLYQEVADAIVSVDRRSVSEVAKAVLRCVA